MNDFKHDVNRLETELKDLEKFPGINGDRIRAMKKDIAYYRVRSQELDFINEGLGDMS